MASTEEKKEMPTICYELSNYYLILTNIVLNVHAFHGTTWYSSANRSGNDVNEMVAPFCTPTCLLFCKLFKGIWNNYVEIQWKIMQVIFIIFWCIWGKNSLSDPTRQHKVWRKKLLHYHYVNTKWSHWKHITQRIFLPIKSTAVCLFHWYQIKLRIWSSRKQYYLGFWAFSELKYS